MRAGSLRERVTVQAPGMTQNEYGELIPGWTNFAASVPASVLDVSGREFLAAAANQSVVETKITIRALAGVLPSMRVVHGADVYRIEAVLRQRDASLLLMCSRGLP